MGKAKEVLIVGFALFSMFFGAGNLILPTFLGQQAGSSWLLVTVGFFITAVFIPILGIFAHAKVQGTMYDFGKKVSHKFSLVYCFIVYAISISLPAPRTASVTHEMAIQPFFSSSYLATSLVYFILVFVFVMNRSSILDLIGKFLTPLIIIILVSVIGVGIFSSADQITQTVFKTPFINGLLEGYQTFDAIGAIVIGGVLVVSLQAKKAAFQFKKKLLIKAGFIAGIGLILIYAGLIYNGALFGSSFAKNATRTDMLTSLSTQTLGKVGAVFLSVLVALACFTTAVAIVTGTADYFKGLYNNSQKAYTITAVIGCVLGIVIGQFDVHYIIVIALPALMFIYPITIVLIILNVLPERLASPLVFRATVGIAFLFSIPDFLGFIISEDKLVGIRSLIPFSEQSLGWVLPTIIAFVTIYLIEKTKHKKSE